jgi:hypothetical protein
MDWSTSVTSASDLPLTFDDDCEKEDSQKSDKYHATHPVIAAKMKIDPKSHPPVANWHTPKTNMKRLIILVR